MKVPVFITGSSLLLALWLGLTFMSSAPLDTYIPPNETLEQTVEIETDSTEDLADID